MTETTNNETTRTEEAMEGAMEGATHTAWNGTEWTPVRLLHTRNPAYGATEATVTDPSGLVESVLLLSHLRPVSHCETCDEASDAAEEVQGQTFCPGCAESQRANFRVWVSVPEHAS